MTPEERERLENHLDDLRKDINWQVTCMQGVEFDWEYFHEVCQEARTIHQTLYPSADPFSIEMN